MKMWPYKKGDSLVVSCYLSASEIWPDKGLAFGRRGLIREGHDKGLAFSRKGFIREGLL